MYWNGTELFVKVDSQTHSNLLYVKRALAVCGRHLQLRTAIVCNLRNMRGRSAQSGLWSQKKKKDIDIITERIIQEYTKLCLQSLTGNYSAFPPFSGVAGGLPHPNQLVRLLAAPGLLESESEMRVTPPRS